MKIKKPAIIIRISLEDKRKHRFLSLAILGLAATISVIVAIFFEEISGMFPICLFKYTTGYHCVSCGATRAVEHIIRGDVTGAIYYNPLFVVFLIFCIWNLIRFSYSAFSSKVGFFKLEIGEHHFYIAAIVILLFWFIRNTHIYQQFLY